MRERRHARAQVGDDRVQQLRIEEGLGITQGALGHARQAEAFASGGVVENLLDVPQTLQGRAEKGDQVGDQQMIGKQITIAVRRQLVQLPQPKLERLQDPRIDDRRASSHADSKASPSSERNT